MITLDDYSRGLSALDGPALVHVVRAALEDVGLEAVGRAQDRVTGGSPLRSRTGHLRRSLRHVVRPQGGAMEMALRAGGGERAVVYAGAHEYGATIRPKRGKYLRVPLPAALTGAGVDRLPGPLRDVAPDRFRFVPTARGGLLIDKATEQAWYALVRQVTIPQRQYLAPSVREASEALGPALAEHLRRRLP